MQNVFKKIKMPKVAVSGSSFKTMNVRKVNGTTILAFISYLNVLSIFSFMVSKNKPFVRFHAKQGLILVAFFALALFSFYVPFLPWLLAAFYVLCILWGIIMVILGRERSLPLIGKLGQKI